MSWDKKIIMAIEEEIMMAMLVRLFFNLLSRLRNQWRYLTRWVEEQQLIEIEALTLNGPKYDCIPFHCSSHHA